KMERAGRARPLPDAGFGGDDVHRLGRRPGRQPGERRDPQGRPGPLPAVLGALRLTAMKVKVLYFASVREKLGKEAEEIELPAGVSTVAALRSHLRGRGGDFEAVFSEKKLIRTAVNQDMVQPAAAIKAGDEVAFFPPVTGG